MANKKKLATSVAAVATAAALLLGGTFAWQSVNQTALNEGADTVNPGGRLHNDMWYVSAEENNNDIYVENFAEEDIFARVRLSEYMEIVLNQGTPGEKAVAVAGSKTDKDPAGETDTTGRNLYDYTYATHYFHDVDNDPTTPSNATEEYWEWTMGNADSVLPYYMPTFNKNKDSVAPDLNGLYRDRVGGISDRSWKQYTELDGETALPETYSGYASDSSKNGKAIYDADSNMDDELKELDAVALENIINRTTDITAYEKAIKLQEETHEAKPVGETKGLISLTKWLAMVNTDGVYNEDKHGGYWVYDDTADGEDVDTAPDGAGWVYWSSPIKGGEATGLLLDGIKLKNVMDDTWYYAIEAVGQFVTANDLGSVETGDGFYANGETITDGAFELLGKVIGFEEKLTINGPTGLVMGQTAQYSVSMTRGGVPVEAPAVTWSIEPTVAAAAEDGGENTVAGVTISETGLVTVADNAQVGLSFDVVAATASVSVRQTVTIGYPTLTLYTDSVTQTLIEEDVYQSYKVVFTDSEVATDQFEMTSITDGDGTDLTNGSWNEWLNEISYDSATQILTAYDYYGWGLKITFGAEGTEQTYVAEFLPVETLEITVNSDGTATGELGSWDDRYYALKFKDAEGNPIDAQISNVALSGEYANGTTYEPFNGSVKDYLFVKDNEQHVAFTADYNGQQIDIIAKYETAYNGSNDPIQVSMAEMTYDSDSDVYAGVISDSFLTGNGNSSSGVAASYSFVTEEGKKVTLRSKEGTPLTEGSAIIDTNGLTYLSLENSNMSRTVTLEGVDEDDNVYTYVFTVIKAPAYDVKITANVENQPDYVELDEDERYTSLDIMMRGDTEYRVPFINTYKRALGFADAEATIRWHSGNYNYDNLHSFTDDGVLIVTPYFHTDESSGYEMLYPSAYVTLGGQESKSETTFYGHIYSEVVPIERGKAHRVSEVFSDMMVEGDTLDLNNGFSFAWYESKNNTFVTKDADGKDGTITIGYDEPDTLYDNIYTYVTVIHSDGTTESLRKSFYPVDPKAAPGETVTLTVPVDTTWSDLSDELIDFAQNGGTVTFTMPSASVGSGEKIYTLNVIKSDGSTTTFNVVREADPIVVKLVDNGTETVLTQDSVVSLVFDVTDLGYDSDKGEYIRTSSSDNIQFKAYYTGYGAGETEIKDVQWMFDDRSYYLGYNSITGDVDLLEYGLKYQPSSIRNVFVKATTTDGRTILFPVNVNITYM